MNNGYPVRSVTLPLPTPNHLGDQPQFTPISTYLDQVVALGYNAIQVVNSYGVLRHFQDSAPDPSLAIVQNDADLIAFAQAAQARGISITLQPFYHVNGQISGSSSTGGDRPGPADPQAWFDNFRGLVLKQAALAEAMGAQRFLIFGDELQSGIFAQSLSLCLQFPTLVADVRKVFHGQIGVHSATLGDYMGTDENILRAVDFIGVAVLGSWTDKNNPTIDELKAAFLRDGMGAHPLRLMQSLADFYGKPVLLADLALRSWDGANRDEGLIHRSQAPLTVDQGEQRDMYEAALSMLSQFTGSWFMGVSNQNLTRLPEGYGTARFLLSDVGENFVGKLAEQTIRDWNFGVHEVPGKDLIGSSYADRLYGNASSDRIEGGPGNDRIDAGAGNDVIAGGPMTRQPTVATKLLINVEGFEVGGVMPAFELRVDGVLTGDPLRVVQRFGVPARSGDVLEVTIDTSKPIHTIEFSQLNWMYFGPDKNRLMQLDRVQIGDTVLDLSQIHRDPVSAAPSVGRADTANGGRLYFDFGPTGRVFSGTAIPVSDDDTIEGGPGIDTVRFASARGDASVVRSAGGWMVSSPADGVDRLTGLERLQFADGGLALDLDGHAGQVARLLGALFGKAGVSNKAYVGIGLSLLDAGMEPLELSALAISTGTFAQLAGGRSNAQFVDLVYRNVVGTGPDAGQRGLFVGLLDRGEYTQAALALLASTTELHAQQIDLVGLAGAGLPFVPL